MKTLDYAECYKKICVKLDTALLYENISRLGFSRTTSIHPEIIAYLLDSINSPHFFEIGTFEGFIPLLVSELYPDARVMTVDIPFEDRRNSGVYDINPKRKERIIKNRGMINSLPGKTSLILSSQLLWKDFYPLKTKIDLAWLDGDHSGFSPYNDIMFALHNLHPNGVILCDDVVPSDPHDPTINALRFISQDFSLKAGLIQKRSESDRKFIMSISFNKSSNESVSQRLDYLFS